MTKYANSMRELRAFRWNVTLLQADILHLLTSIEVAPMALLAERTGCPLNSVRAQIYFLRQQGYAIGNKHGVGYHLSTAERKRLLALMQAPDPTVVEQAA